MAEQPARRDDYAETRHGKAVHSAESPDRHPAPRWAKTLGLVLAVVILLVLLLLLVGGEHGPGRHLSSSGLGGVATLEYQQP